MLLCIKNLLFWRCNQLKEHINQIREKDQKLMVLELEWQQ